MFEHPGETTIPTSIFVCESGGMVVVCAGTTGYNATVDLRYLWMRQKRLQGSHFANTAQSNEMNQLALGGQLDPCMSRAFAYDDVPLVHQLMHDNKHPHGNMAVLVGAPEFGLGAVGSAPIRLEHPPCRRTTSMAASSVSAVRAAAGRRRGWPGDHRRRRATVAEAMHRGLIACAPADSVGEVARTMIDNDIHAVVVMEGGKALGVVSQTDVALARQGRTAEKPAPFPCGTYVARCATCDADMLLSEPSA